MSGAVSAVAIDAEPAAPIGVLGELVLLRIASDNGATRADMVRDLAPLTSHRLSPSELRNGVDLALARLQAGALVAVHRARYRLTEAGQAAVGGRDGLGGDADGQPGPRQQLQTALTIDGEVEPWDGLQLVGGTAGVTERPSSEHHDRLTAGRQQW